MSDAIQKKTFTEVEAEFHAEQTELMETYGVFYAFSDKQFTESSKPNTEYVRLQYGAYCPRDVRDDYITARNNIMHGFEDAVRLHVDRGAYIKYQLANHEAYLTYDISEALELAQCYWPDTTEADVWAIFNANKHRYEC